MRVGGTSESPAYRNQQNGAVKKGPVKREAVSWPAPEDSEDSIGEVLTVPFAGEGEYDWGFWR